MQLRPYQADVLGRVQAVYKSGRRRALMVAPTGSGKSALTSHMLQRTNKRTLILCHRGELQDMICDNLPVPYGVIGGARGVPVERVHVGMMQTVQRRLDVLPAYDWVISDEAHLAMCPGWRAILQHYAAAWHLGMSATPCRLDGIGLGAEFNEIVYGPSIRELTERGYLAPCRVFAPSVDARVSRRSNGDSLAEAAAALDRGAITGDVISHFRRIGGARQAIVFCCSREHAEHVAVDFSRAGIPALNVDGGMPRTERNSRLAAFESRRVQALVNVDLLTTGFDCPQIEVGVFLRPTESLALYLQMVGRILRIHPGKRDAVLIDHVGNVLTHGMPDEDREWTLDGRLRRAAAPTRIAQCPMCYAVHRPAPRCPSCAHVYVAAPAPRVMTQRDGELVEMTSDRVRELRAANLADLLRAAKCRDDLEEIRKARGYHSRWTGVQMQIRRNKFAA